MAMFISKTALQVNAIVGLVCTVTAGAVISLVLTRPERIAAAVAQHEYGAIATAVAAELARWIHALVRFL
jgi:hypothetical protein